MAKVGRPPLPDGERRDLIRIFVMNDRENNLLDELCSELQLSRSAVIRYCIGSIHDLTFKGESVAQPEEFK